MKLSKLFKFMDPRNTILIVEAKSHITIYEGLVEDFSDDREWKVKKISDSYSFNFEIHVKEVKKKDAPL